MDGEPAVGGAQRGARAVSAHRRWLMFALGWVFFALGIVGLVLPIVPTAPFMLLALWAFSIGSERFHRWLFHHPVFGPPLQRWQRDRVIPVWGKAVAIVSMTGSVLVAWLVMGAPWYALLAMAAVLGGVAVFVLRCPSRPRGVDPRPA